MPDQVGFFLIGRDGPENRRIVKAGAHHEGAIWRQIQPLHRAAMGCVGFNRRCLASHANKSSNQYPQNLPSPQDQRIQVWQKPLKAQPQRRNKVK